jgi:hypothetical protein
LYTFIIVMRNHRNRRYYLRKLENHQNCSSQINRHAVNEHLNSDNKRNKPDDFITETTIPNKRMKSENRKDTRKVRVQGRPTSEKTIIWFF